MGRTLLAIVCGLWVAGFAVAGDDAFAVCAPPPEARSSYEAALCYYRQASATGAWQAAEAHLATLQHAASDDLWLTLVRGHIVWALDEQRAEALYRKAAAGFATTGNVRGEILARGNLRTLLLRSGRVDAAAEQAERVATLGEQTDDRELRLRALVIQARQLFDTGTHLGRAWRVLQQVQALLRPDDSYFLHKEVLADLGYLETLLGRYPQALGYFQALQRAAAAADDLGGIALAGVNLANSRFELASRNGEPVLVELLTEARQALLAARRAELADLEVAAERLLGELLVMDDPAAAEQHLARCARLAAELEQPARVAECQWVRARLVARSDPRRAQALIDDAVHLMQRSHDHLRLAWAWRQHMRIVWIDNPPAVALAQSERALAVIEALRELQASEQGRSQLLSAWAPDYHWLSGRLLRAAAGSGDSQLLAAAFDVTERMRARSLLDSLRSPQAPVARTANARAHVLDAIVDTNRRLLTLDAGADRQALLDELRLLELQELQLRDHAVPGVAVPATLQDVQAALVADEALLSFQVDLDRLVTGEPAGGAWLVLVTREAVRAHRVPDRAVLAQLVPAFTGLVAGGQPGVAAVSLHERLFGDTLAALPDNIERLIVVADGDLHGLPLAALRASASAAPLGVRYQLSRVPSASLWLHWRRLSRTAFARPALILADPAGIDMAGARTPAALPHAAEEGRFVRAELGADSRLLTGAAAHEQALKSAPLARYGVLHLATHALVDAAHPQRSAILLAASANDDGLLQVREILDLPLAGQLVVLASCRSATGTWLPGEGIMGLARGFFVAGAAGVVGSLWPVRDDHARTFFEHFYPALASGASAGAAVRQARAAMFDDGWPASAWAAFTLIGDATVAPLPPRPRRGVVSPVAAGVAGCLLLFAAAAYFARRRAFRQDAAMPQPQDPG